METTVCQVCSDSTFGDGRPGWLGQMDKVRNVVRQEMISRQLGRHLRPAPARILDVGAGQGTQSIRLARAGHQVLAAEPDPAMRAAFSAALDAEPGQVRDRITLSPASAGDLASAAGGEVFDAVLLLGVLMYLPASGPVIAELAAHVAPGGLLAVAARTATSALWRPAARQDWPAALAAFEEHDLAGSQGRDMRYVNEIGAPARADSFEVLTSTAAAWSWRIGMACGSPWIPKNSTPRRHRIPGNWPRSWTSKSAWVPPTRTGSSASSRI